MLYYSLLHCAHEKTESLRAWVPCTMSHTLKARLFWALCTVPDSLLLGLGWSGLSRGPFQECFLGSCHTSNHVALCGCPKAKEMTEPHKSCPLPYLLGSFQNHLTVLDTAANTVWSTKWPHLRNQQQNSQDTWNTISTQGVCEVTDPGPRTHTFSVF